MFFPKAEKRFACSFFKTPGSEANDGSVEIIPTNIRSQILSIKNQPTQKAHYILYLTAQAGFTQALSEILNILSNREEEFTVFLDKNSYQKNAEEIEKHEDYSENIHFSIHGDMSFEKLLATCNGIISTAGHTLLSESMYLGIPVYAMPMDLYEQQLSAKVIGDNKFGVNHPILTEDKLDEFIKNNGNYRESIFSDVDVLYKKGGLEHLLSYINKFL